MNEHKSEQKMKMKSEQDEDERDGNVGLASHKTHKTHKTHKMENTPFVGNERVQNQNQNYDSTTFGGVCPDQVSFFGGVGPGPDLGGRENNRPELARPRALQSTTSPPSRGAPAGA